MLLDAKSVTYTAPELGGTSGVHVLALLKKFGIYDDDRPRRAIHAKGGIDISQKVARGEAEIGITLISEIVPVKGAQDGRAAAGRAAAVDRLHVRDPGEQQATRRRARLRRAR